MKNNELLKKYAGISTRIRRIFAYHYDQIQREVQTEILTLNPELQAQFMDLVIEYMEESINWPDPDDQETFEKQLLGQCHENNCLHHCPILWMGTKRGRPRGNHFQYTLFQFQCR